MKIGRNLRLLAGALAAAAILVGCGGGGGTEAPRVSINRVLVAGDSLADVGTFGFKATVQNSADPKAGFPIFPQIVASNFGVTGQCNYFVFTGTTFANNAACTNYAVAGGAIYYANQADPRNIPNQLTALAQVNGTFGAGDLIIVDGGGNDAADLLGAYLGASRNSAGYVAFLARLLDTATISQTLAQPNGAALAAGLYMQKLADRYYTTIKVSTLDKGATHVAVLNMPDVTVTPRLKQLMAGIAAQQGATTAQQLTAALSGWIGAFNQKLAANVAGDTRIALVDFATDIVDEVNNPSAYALANTSTPVCPVTGTDSSGLPSYTFQTCTSAALDAAPPAGQGPGWWQRYAFSDSFHPTPYAHSLLASSVSRAIARAGWI